MFRLFSCCIVACSVFSAAVLLHVPSFQLLYCCMLCLFSCCIVACCHFSCCIAACSVISAAVLLHVLSFQLLYCCVLSFQLLYCCVCCEPFHTFCLDENLRPHPDNLENWCCRNCQYCNVCGRQDNVGIRTEAQISEQYIRSETLISRRL